MREQTLVCQQYFFFSLSLFFRICFVLFLFLFSEMGGMSRYVTLLFCVTRI